MKSDEDAPILRMLARLPTGVPDASRTDRVRARCRAALAPRPTERPRPGFRERILGPALVGGFCLLYLSAVIRDVLRLHGVF